MYQQIKTNVHLLVVLVLAAAGLVLLSTVMGSNGAPTVSAQAPPVTPSPFVVSEEALAFFRERAGQPAELSASVDNYNLSISKTADKGEVTTGDSIKFFVFINNLSSQQAEYILFQDDAPSQMSNVVYDFPTGITATEYTDSAGNTVWLLDSIPALNQMTIEVRGELSTGLRFDTATNVAKIIPLVAATDPTQTKSAQASVRIENPSGSGGLTYFPLIRRDPTPTPTPTPPIVLAHHETFNDPDDQPWITDDLDQLFDGCTAELTSGQYWVRLEQDEVCLPPARDSAKPEKPYRTYGEFEVVGYHSEGESNASYGIFINGAGGSNYYLFRIWPNNACASGGDWQLIRRKDSSDTTLTFGSCDTNIKRGYGFDNRNILKISHEPDRTISVYANNVRLGAVRDNESQHLTGEATGLYLNSDDENILIKWDDFKVYKFP